MKCKPEEVPEEAVEEYAAVLRAEWAKSVNAASPYPDQWNMMHYRAEARRAISDGACPSGWEWRFDGDEVMGLGGPAQQVLHRYRLIRRPTPTPPDPVAEAARETDEAMRMVGGYWHEDGPTARTFKAIVSEMRARAAKGGGK